MNLNPMYQTNKAARPEANLHQDAIKTKKVRKTRSDKKTDIKVPLQDEHKRRMRWAAYKRNVTVTFLATTLVEKAVTYPSLKNLPVVDYENTYNYVHVKLSSDIYEVVVDLSIHWDVSIREGTFRLLLFMIESGDI